MTDTTMTETALQWILDVILTTTTVHTDGTPTTTVVILTTTIAGENRNGTTDDMMIGANLTMVNRTIKHRTDRTQGPTDTTTGLPLEVS